MANPCCCCGPNTGARILAIVSLLVALALVATSAYVLKDYYEQRDSDANKALRGATNAIDNVAGVFGVKTNANDAVDERYRILIGCSAAGVAVGGFQLLTSIFLCIGGAGKTRAPSGIYGFVNTVGFLALVGSLVCLFYKEIYVIDNLKGVPDAEKAWLAAIVGDAVFLLYGICASVAFMRS